MAKIIHTNVGTGIEDLEEWMGEGVHALDEAAVDGNVVSYNVPGSVNSQKGDYTAHFVNILPSGGERTHKMRYKILPNPGR